MKTKFRDFQPGTKVRYTGKFLRNTGQTTGGAGQETFIVQAVEGEFIRTYTPIHPGADVWTAEEHAQYPMLRFVRIHRENLHIVGQLDSRNCP